MNKDTYRSMNTRLEVSRRDMLKAGSVVGVGLVLGSPVLWSCDQSKTDAPPSKPKTNIDDVTKIARTATSLPGPYPGKLVQVTDERAMVDGNPVGEVVQAMFDKGITNLTGKDLKESFRILFNKEDIVGIKVNPVGSGMINTKLEVVDAIIKWLEDSGLPRKNIIIWDRFDYMLADAGYKAKRFPGIEIVGLQTLDEAAASGESEDNSRWQDENGRHLSEGNFDKDVYYWADVDCPKDDQYLNQHVFNGKESYFGNLVTKRLTKIINVPVFKNTGNGVSMATKNMGYGAICNTGRLHRPLFFDVCTEVLAFPAVRDKMVLNVMDGLRAQYDGGPMAAANFQYIYNTLFFSTDPIAMDMIGHQLIVEKRKSMSVNVNEHPRFTKYLRYAERLGLGVADPAKIEHVVL